MERLPQNLLYHASHAKVGVVCQAPSDTLLTAGRHGISYTSANLSSAYGDKCSFTITVYLDENGSPRLDPTQAPAGVYLPRPRTGAGEVQPRP